MALSYVDFIAPDVEVCVKYHLNREPRWYTGKVVKVLDRYLDENIDECVKCVVKYGRDKYTETFCDKDYNTQDENAWCFGSKFVALVEHIKNIVDDFDYTEDEDESNESTDDDYTETTETQTDEENETESNPSEDIVSKEVDEAIQPRRNHSLLNNIGATMFMLAPWIASGVALFNARKEIFEALRHL